MSGDLYQRFVGKLKIHQRAALELCVLAVICICANEAVALKREPLIQYEAISTGTSAAQIIDRQNASSGMWAFSEGLEFLYLLALFYLLRPMVFNAASRLLKRRSLP